MNAGTYAITATTTNPNFEIGTPKASYTITPKALTVSVESKTKVYGNTDPTNGH